MAGVAKQQIEKLAYYPTNIKVIPINTESQALLCFLVFGNKEINQQKSKLTYYEANPKHKLNPYNSPKSQFMLVKERALS